MKRLLMLLLPLVHLTSANAQSGFYNGYIIDENNNQTECLIRNLDWRNNPESFTYKLREEGEVLTGTLRIIREFGVPNLFKYRKVITKVDKEPNLTFSRNPFLVEDTLFMKVLVEGTATLYQFTSDEGIKYFFSSSGKPVQQLIYREYKVDDSRVMTNSTMKVAKNVSYQQQLLNDVKCGSTSEATVRQLKYRNDDLVGFFHDYNQCKDASYQVSDLEPERKLFYFKLAPGVDMNSLYLENPSWSDREFDFGNKINFRIGFEVELVLPYNKGKWSLFLEPTYQSYSSESIRPNDDVAVADYQSIELPFGLRYYAFQSKPVSWYLNAMIYADFPMKSTIRVNTTNLLEVRSRPSFGVGTGLKFNKLTTELRFSPARNVLSEYLSWTCDYSKVSFIVGYQVF